MLPSAQNAGLSVSAPVAVLVTRRRPRCRGLRGSCRSTSTATSAGMRRGVVEQQRRQLVVAVEGVEAGLAAVVSGGVMAQIDPRRRGRRAVDEHLELARRERGPGLVARQRLGDDDGDAVARRGQLGEVDASRRRPAARRARTGAGARCGAAASSSAPTAPAPLLSMKLKVPCAAIGGTSSRSVAVSSSTDGTLACALASSCISQQKARSLSVSPTGWNAPCRRGA